LFSALARLCSAVPEPAAPGRSTAATGQDWWTVLTGGWVPPGYGYDGVTGYAWPN
jgi:hypothetical protein